MPPQTLAQGVLVDERRQLGGHIIVAPECEIGADPLLEADKPKLLQAAGLRRREALVGDVGERGPSPECEPATKQQSAQPRIPRNRRSSTACEQPLEPRRIELLGSNRS